MIIYAFENNKFNEFIGDIILYKNESKSVDQSYYIKCTTTNINDKNIGN